MSFDEQKPSPETGGPASRVLLPVTPAQERCWFLNKLRPGTPSLNVSVRWEILGRFPAPAIEQCFREIIARHEILRTRFVEIDGEPRQEVFETVPFKLAVVDLTMLPEERRLDQMNEIGRREAQAPFDLAEAPLIRAVLVRLEEERAFLMLTIHQSAFDGWSIRVLGRELGAIGAAICEGRPHNLPELPLQYGDYALWRQECLRDGSLDAELEYWRGKLEGAPYFEVEPDKERPPERTPNSAMVSIDLPYEFGLKLEEVAKTRGMSFFNLGSAIIISLLHRYTGKTDISFGTQIAGRDDTDLEDLIGVFINNIVMRNDLSDNPQFSDLMARVTDTSRQAMANQNMPFHKLVEALRPPRDVQRTPLISVNVILQKAFMEDMDYGAFKLLGRPSPTPGALYDFTFLMVGRLTGWRMTVEYNTDLFEKSTAEQLLHAWREVMEAVVADPAVRIGALLPNLEPRDLEKKYARNAAIEAALEDHADVEEAVAFSRVADTDAAPYAYVTPTATTRRPLETLPALLMQHLAQAGIAAPRGLSILASLPRNASGDIDLAALPAPPKAALLPQVAAEQRAAPTEIEAKLIGIWREQLGLQQIDRNSNFFDLGGHSLLAVRMVTQASVAFGSKIDVLALFKAPTLRQFAEHIAGLVSAEPSREDWKIVPIQPNGAKTPVIAINNTILYYGLSKQLGAERPFIGVQNYKPDADAPSEVRTLEEIASDYVKLVRAAQPEGPYILIGLCVAGAIAYEVAQQLKRDGETPPTVVMFDSWAPGHFQSLPKHRQVARRIASWLHLQSGRIADWRAGRMSAQDFVLRFHFMRRFCGLAVRLGLMKKMPEREFLWHPGFEGYLTRARTNYRPKPYPGDVLIFRSEEFPKGALFDRNFGWRQLVGGRLEIEDIAGGHLTMCAGDSAGVVAHHIDAFLAGSD